MKRWIKLLCLVIPVMIILSSLVFVGANSNNMTKRAVGDSGWIDPAPPATTSGTGAASAAINKKGGAIFLEENTSYTMSGGTISNHSNTYGGAIFINPGATFTMKGGTIKNCSADYGGAIYVRAGATCNIEGGAITGCSANKNGAAIYVESGATLNLSSAAEVDSKDVYNEGGSVSTDLIQVGNTSSTTYLHYLEFGSYPQTYVGDAMNATLESWFNSTNPTKVKTYQIGPSDLSEKSFLGKSKGDTALAASDDPWLPVTSATKITYEGYEYNGELYARGKCFPWYSWEFTFTYKDGTAIKPDGTICWFKVEPIEWVVLNYDAWKAGADIQLMTLNVIVSNLRFGGSEWVTSSLRSWMNNEFIDQAFSEEEQQMLTPTTLKNNKDGGAMGTGQDTTDSVYILSQDELCAALTTTDSRMASPTDFTLSLFNASGFTRFSYSFSTTYRNGVCSYACRQKGADDGTIIYCLDNNGSFKNDNPGYEHSIRPVLCLNI